MPVGLGFQPPTRNSAKLRDSARVHDKIALDPGANDVSFTYAGITDDPPHPTATLSQPSSLPPLFAMALAPSFLLGLLGLLFVHRLALLL